MAKDKSRKKGGGKRESGKAAKRDGAKGKAADAVEATKPAKPPKPAKVPKPPKPAKPAKPAKPPKASKAPKKDELGKTARAAKAKALDLVSNPIVAEVVAATLVAAAAALRDPKKARQIAASTGDTIGTVTRSAREEGGVLWKLAMDIARRSVDALGEVGGDDGAIKRGSSKPARPDRPSGTD